MDPPDTLSTVAEIALGLAGFTGLLVVLGRQPGGFSPSEAFRLLILLVASLSALFLALIPLALHDSGLSGFVLWRVSSLIMAGSILASAGFLVRRVRSFQRGDSEAYSPVILVLISTGAGLVFVAQILNASGVLGSPSPGAYSFGLLFFIAAGAVQFVRILFVPSE
jgi:hypothetical protein